MKEEKACPSVSIIIPVYNAAPYLRRCLDSIERQTIRDWECICVDDASTDGSGAILDEYAARDSRFVVIHKKENSGAPSAGRNAGLDAARGEWIGFVDNDDWIEPDTYELALDAALRYDADIVQWRNTTQSESGLAASAELAEGFFDVGQSPAYFRVLVWNKLFRASLVRDVRFPLGAKIGKEDDIFSIITYVLATKCFFMNRVLYCHDITHDHLALRKHTAETVKSLACEVQKMCAFVEKARAEQKNRTYLGFFLAKSSPQRTWPFTACPSLTFAFTAQSSRSLNGRRRAGFLRKR